MRDACQVCWKWASDFSLVTKSMRQMRRRTEDIDNDQKDCGEVI